MSWIGNCERLDAHYGAHRRALHQLLGVEAIVVRRGSDDAEEPWPEKPATYRCACGRLMEDRGWPGPPPASYALQVKLEAGIVMHASDHHRYGLRHLAQPVEDIAPYDRWHVMVLRRRNTRGDWRDAPVTDVPDHPRRALTSGYTLAGGYGRNVPSAVERHDVDRLVSALRDALAGAQATPRRMYIA